MFALWLLWQGSPEKQYQQDIYKYTWDVLREWAHTIMEAKKAQGLPSASWWTRKAICVIHSKSKAWKSGPNATSPGLNPKAQESGAPVSRCRRRWVSQLKQRVNLPFLCLSVICRSSTEWMMPTCSGEDDCYSVYWFKCSSLLSTPSQTHPEIMFHQLLGHLLIQLTCKINHRNYTVE